MASLPASTPSTVATTATTAKTTSTTTTATAATAPARRSTNEWTREEHERFLEARKLYPDAPWRVLAAHVGTRTTRQVMTHANKIALRQERHARGLRRAGRPRKGTTAASRAVTRSLSPTRSDGPASAASSSTTSTTSTAAPTTVSSNGGRRVHTIRMLLCDDVESSDEDEEGEGHDDVNETVLRDADVWTDDEGHAQDQRPRRRPVDHRELRHETALNEPVAARGS